MSSERAPDASKTTERPDPVDRELVRQMADQSPEQQPTGEGAERGLVEIVARGQQRGEIRGDLPAARLVHKLVSMQLMSCFAWAADELGGRSLSAVLREDLDFFLRGAAP